jgi:hypothetical protein
MRHIMRRIHSTVDNISSNFLTYFAECVGYFRTFFHHITKLSSSNEGEFLSSSFLLIASVNDVSIYNVDPPKVEILL